MKRILHVVLFSSSILFTSQLSAQCTEIVRPTFRIITNESNVCERTISFDFIPQSNGQKSINLTVKVDGITVINDCYSFSHLKDIQTNYTSAPFSACNMAGIEVAISTFNSGSCGNVVSGSACGPTWYSSGGAPLPVLFSAFSVTRNKDLVTLKWETANEISNTGFAIERNTNGNWQQVGFIATLAMNGNSSDKLNYEFSEINTAKGMTQYRLKQVDIDGAGKYSDIRMIRGTEQDAKTSFFPNPSVNGHVNVVFADAATRDIAITDMAGRTVKQWNAFNSNSLQVTGLNTGMFSIRIINRATGTQTTEKIIVAAR